MKCTECGSDKLKLTRENIRYAALPSVRLEGVEIRTCESCGERYEVIPRIAHLNRQLVTMLTGKRAMLAPEEVRFLRKSIGWSGRDFAAHMGVDPATVSRWENGHEPMSATADRLLRMFVVHVTPVTDYDAGSLTDVGDTSKAIKMAFTLTGGDWRPAAA